jgi:ubiquitin-like protein Nedd8
MTGKVFKLHVQAKHRILEIEEQIEELEGIPSSQQRLVFQGKLLADRKTAADYALKQGDMLRLVLTLRGGGP